MFTEHDFTEHDNENNCSCKHTTEYSDGNSCSCKHTTESSQEHKPEEAAQENPCQKDLELCTRECEELRNVLAHVAADFENFQKRTERDRANFTHIIQANFLRSLLPIVDDFDRALAQQASQEKTSELQAQLAGFELISKSLYKFLTSQGAEPMSAYTDFDPEFHEALSHVESHDHKSGQIVDIIQKGYMYKGSVLRPARVTVAR